MEQVVKSDKGIVLESENSQKTKTKKKRKSTTSTTQEEANVCERPKKRVKKEKNNVKGNLPERKYVKPRHPYSKRVGSHAEMMKKHYKIKSHILKVQTPDKENLVSQ